MFTNNKDRHPPNGSFPCDLCGEQKVWVNGKSGQSIRGGNLWICSDCRQTFARAMRLFSVKYRTNPSFFDGVNDVGRVDDMEISDLIYQVERYRKELMARTGKRKVAIPYDKYLDDSRSFGEFKNRMLNFIGEGGAAGHESDEEDEPLDDDEIQAEAEATGDMEDPMPYAQQIMHADREKQMHPLNAVYEKYQHQSVTMPEIENLFEEYKDSFYLRSSKTARYAFGDWNKILEENDDFLDFKNAIRKFSHQNRLQKRGGGGLGYGKGQAVIDLAAEKFNRPRNEVKDLYNTYISSKLQNNVNGHIYWSDAINVHDAWPEFVEDIKNFAMPPTPSTTASAAYSVAGAPSFEFSGLRL